MKVFTLLADYHDSAVCFCTVVMTCRKYPLYRKVLKMIKTLFPTINIHQIMADYEASMRKAIKTTFPEARLLGCRSVFLEILISFEIILKRFIFYSPSAVSFQFPNWYLDTSPENGKIFLTYRTNENWNKHMQALANLLTNSNILD